MKTDKLTEGFYTALGTPLTEDGTLDAESFLRHIDDQVEADASGLLIMGSMGIEAYIRNRDYPEVAYTGAMAVSGRCPVFVGAMDTSASRVLERIESLGDIPIDGVVATVPFYNTLTQQEVVQFYRMVAEQSPYPVYMYDLAVVTKTKIETATAETIMRTIPNVAGIKSGDLILARTLSNLVSEEDLDFSVMYSGLDTFDVAYGYGINYQLDGMFACTPELARRMYRALKHGDRTAAAAALDAILRIRGIFINHGVLPSFTAAMNLLGYSGRFHPDYARTLDPAEVEDVRTGLVAEGLL